jgi:hypothetical protein
MAKETYGGKEQQLHISPSLLGLTKPNSYIGDNRTNLVQLMTFFSVID